MGASSKRERSGLSLCALCVVWFVVLIGMLLLVPWYKVSCGHSIGMIVLMVLSLGMTISIEVGLVSIIGAFMGKRLVSPWFVVMLNLVTNPPVVLLSNLAFWYFPAAAWVVELGLEAGVVALEGRLYKYRTHIKRPFLLAFIVNLASWAVGVVLSCLMWYGEGEWFWVLCVSFAAWSLNLILHIVAVVIRFVWQKIGGEVE